VRFEPVLENKETIYFKWRPTAFGVTRNWSQEKWIE
jgi:hypothetical protein